MHAPCKLASTCKPVRRRARLSLEVAIFMPWSPRQATPPSLPLMSCQLHHLFRLESAHSAMMKLKATKRYGGNNGSWRNSRKGRSLVHGKKEWAHRRACTMVAIWQNLIPSFPWIATGWRAWGRNPRRGRDQILQCSVAEP